MESSWNPALRPDSSPIDTHFNRELEDQQPLMKKDATSIPVTAAPPPQTNLNQDSTSIQLLHNGHDVGIALSRNDIDNTSNVDRDHPSANETLLRHAHSQEANEIIEFNGDNSSDREVIHGNVADNAKSGSLLRGEILTESSTNESFAVLEGSKSIADKPSIKNDINDAFEAEMQNAEQTGLGSLDRTNSFPEIPPLFQSKLLLPHSLPRSQVEIIMEGDENLDSHQSLAPVTSSAGVAGTHSVTSNITDSRDGGENFFPRNTLDQHRIPSQPSIYEDERARFEEGFPLVANSEPEATRTNEEFFREKISTANVGDDDSEIFDYSRHLDDEAFAYRPRPLDRKSTTQVLASMQYTSDVANHLTPDEHGGRPSLTNHVGGGGSVVSSETSKSQVLAEEVAQETGKGLEDEDLSEIWKAALGDDELLEEKSLPLDPSNFFEDDEEGFLEDDTHAVDQEKISPALATSKPFEPAYSPKREKSGLTKTESGERKPNSTYVPASASSQQSGLRSSFEPSRPFVPSRSTDPSSMQNSFMNAQQSIVPPATAPTPPRPHLQKTAQSFADKSKGGYTSPYDLPMDVTRPKKRHPLPTAPAHLDNQDSSSRPPPPRSSSMYPGALPSQGTQSSSPNIPTSQAATAAKGLSSLGPRSTSNAGSFFEELPLAKPRPSSSLGRASAPVAQLTQTPPSTLQGIDTKQLPPEQQRSASGHSNTNSYQLLPPERLSLYSDEPSHNSTRQAIPVMNSRYSPAPVQSSALPPSNRYASSPTVPRPPSTHTLLYQPRTSSPLTQHSTALQQQQNPERSFSSQTTYPASVPEETLNSPNTFSPQFPFFAPQQLSSHNDRQFNQGNANTQSHSSQLSSDQSLHSFPAQAPPAYSSPQVSSRGIYTLGANRSIPDDNTTLRDSHAEQMNTFMKSPPKRSQTQSPTVQRPNDVSQPSLQPYQRPASVNNYAPSSSLQEVPASSAPSQRSLRTNSQSINFIKPIDGRELDNLERWKGCPIVSFGFGGSIVKMFPQHIPRYASGQQTPMIKCSAGEVKIENGKSYALNESLATFPGPLKAKGKKKEVLDWLQKKLHDMEGNYRDNSDVGPTLPDSQRRQRERILLWKVMKVLVECDGVIDGNETSEKAFRALLSPAPNQGDEINFQAQYVGITQREGLSSVPDVARPEVLEELRKKLLHGDREQAVWHAVDNRLWAHALLLSSTLDKSIWKQVSQEFVRQELKVFGKNTESLAALYQIFAGNWEESTDELVPPSARAGLQMVSKSAGSGPTKGALDGLDRWQETLTLILSNRTPDDGKALLSLGQLLASYCRTEAAHICYIFAKTPGLFGGPDDPQVSVALLGANHLRRPFDYGRDFDSILLTEVHDFAHTTLASSSASTVSPHLQSYKLYHAIILAEYGHKSEAQQYCDTIFATLKSTTKPSPYYHTLLAGALESLQDRLKQAPRDNSGSWISKPSIDKMSGSIWAKFNSYVAGDEDEASSTKSSRNPDAAAGPFARLAGDSPTLSRTPSANDLSSTYSTGTSRPLAPTAPAGTSRYAPGSYTSRSSVEQQRRSAQDSSKALSSEISRPSLAPQQYSSRPVSAAGSTNEPYTFLPQTLPSASRAQRYLPTPPAQPDYGTEGLAMGETASNPYQQLKPTPPPEPPVVQGHDNDFPNIQHSSTLHNPPTLSYQPAITHEASFSPQGLHSSSYQSVSFDESATESHHPLLPNGTQFVQDDIPISYEPPISSYEPPTSDGYEPPSYTPPSYNGDDRQIDVPLLETKPVKSVVDLDDDDDFEARAAALRKEEKARKDREADEAFLKAAEADAQKEKAPKLNSKKSWFGGSWFGGKDKANEVGTPNAPIKVKLGEESSFYFDEQLKKWVNKKAGASEAPSAPTPPPPKVPPSRSVSAAAAAPPSSTPVPPVPPLPLGLGSATSAMRAVSGPDPSPLIDSNQPSRTISPAINSVPSNAGTPPMGPSSEPPSRPATAQSGLSNIDDLIGIPQARKGGTVKKVKKGRGYVDVMAK